MAQAPLRQLLGPSHVLGSREDQQEAVCWRRAGEGGAVVEAVSVWPALASLEMTPGRLVTQAALLSLCRPSAEARSGEPSSDRTARTRGWPGPGL